MTIFDFLEYCIDEGMLKVEIYSLDKGKTVWTGDGDDIPSEYGYAELCSFDIPTEPWHITLNID